jgi:hypothetical protein
MFPVPLAGLQLEFALASQLHPPGPAASSLGIGSLNVATPAFTVELLCTTTVYWNACPGVGLIALAVLSMLIAAGDGGIVSPTSSVQSPFAAAGSAHTVPCPGVALATLLIVPPAVSCGTPTLIRNVTVPLGASVTATLAGDPLPLSGAQLDAGLTGLAGTGVHVQLPATSSAGTGSLNVACAVFTTDSFRTTTVYVNVSPGFGDGLLVVFRMLIGAPLVTTFTGTLALHPFGVVPFAHAVPVPGVAVAVLVIVPPAVSAGTATLITNVAVPPGARLTTTPVGLPLAASGAQLDPPAPLGLAVQPQLFATSSLGIGSLSVANARFTVDVLCTTTV